MSISHEYKGNGLSGLSNVDQDPTAHAYHCSTNRRPSQSVSFSRRHMPGTTAKDPAHRTGASPSRSALRSRTRPDLQQDISNSSSDENDIVRSTRQQSRSATRLPSSAVDSSADLTAPAEWKSTADVARDVYRLWTQIDNFAKSFRPGVATADSDPLEFLLLNKLHAKTVRYVGCLGLATKDGLACWERLLKEQRSLQALVSACIGHSLLEYVFDQPWVGVDSSNEDLFAVSDQDAKEVDAFFRREQHALHSAQCNAGAGSRQSPQLRAFKATTYRLSARIWRLLEPLYQLGQASHNSGEWPTRKLLLDLHSIVETAAHLSRQMRLYPSAIFEWIPPSKGQKFDPDYMDAINIGEMLETSPYTKQPDGRQAVLREDADRERTQPLSLVAIYPALRMHFREHGPAIHDPERRWGPMNHQCKMATQLICKTVVLLHWGKARLAVELLGDGTWREAEEKGDMSRFEKDTAGCVELGKFFLEIHGPNAFVQEGTE